MDASVKRTASVRISPDLNGVDHVCSLVFDILLAIGIAHQCVNVNVAKGTLPAGGRP